MQRGRGGRDEFFDFGDPFSGGFGGFGGQRSLASSFFGGRDPFDDPFFTRPFGSSMFGSSMFGQPSMFGPSSNLFGESPFTGFISDQPSQPSQPNRSRGPVIEEISSGDEGDEQEKNVQERKENPRKHSRSNREPYVEEPDDGPEERRIRHAENRNEFNLSNMMPSHSRSFSFQSSTVTYGGANGAYYTKSTTRKMGDNGVMIEEKKEADTTTGRAEHRVSKGIRDKGHTVTRKLKPDGNVDTMQTLHNLNEDELPHFEETWKGNAKKHLPGWSESHGVHEDIGPSGRMQASRQGWALPSTDPSPEPVQPRRFRGRQS